MTWYFKFPYPLNSYDHPARAYFLLSACILPHTLVLRRLLRAFIRHLPLSRTSSLHTAYTDNADRGLLKSVTAADFAWFNPQFEGFARLGRSMQHINLASQREPSENIWPGTQGITSDNGPRERSSLLQWSTSVPLSWVPTTRHTPLPTGQLSPVSNEVDTPVEPPSLPAMPIHPSRNDSWTSASTHEYEETEDCRDDSWKFDGIDEVVTMAKLEPVEEDVNMDDVTEAPRDHIEIADEQPMATRSKEKRPRGRPRKHPLSSNTSSSKVTKGRSKTGCITCRKRKKKCDEAKPRCELHVSRSLLGPHLMRFLSRHELREECGCLRRLPREKVMEKREGQGQRRQVNSPVHGFTILIQ